MGALPATPLPSPPRGQASLRDPLRCRYPGQRCPNPQHDENGLCADHLAELRAGAAERDAEREAEAEPEVDCPTCHGDGACTSCEGTTLCPNDGSDDHDEATCTDCCDGGDCAYCDGSGVCDDCEGSGVMA